MDTQLIAHVGGELILVAGISVYFYKKTSALETRVQQLEKDNAELINAVEYLNAQMAQLVRVLQGKKPGGHHPHKHHQKREVGSATKVSDTSTPEPTFEPVPQQSEKSDEEDLDAELQEEITELEQSREPTATANCVNGVCKLD